MKRLYYMLLAALLAVLSVSCSKKRYFEIKGELEGLGAQSVTAFYYSAGGVQRVSVPADGNGKFELRGQSGQPTMVIMSLSDGSPMAVLVAKDGDQIKLEGSMDDIMRIKVKGSGVSSDIANWRAENKELLSSGNAALINASVAEYVGAHKSDISSAAILVSCFSTPGYEIMADSLMGLIAPEARPGTVIQNFSAVLASQLSVRAREEVKPMMLNCFPDTFSYYAPSAHKVSLLAFVPENRSVRDSVIPRLKELCAGYGGDRKLEIVEFASTPDSAVWRQSVRSDSASWVQAWTPGSLVSSSVRSLSVPRIPYFIVVDSVGAQILRTHAVSAAVKKVRELVE